MKVTLHEFEMAFAMFEEEFCKTMDTKLASFLLGVKLAELWPAVSAYISKYISEDNLIDIDALRKNIEFGMRCCNGEYYVPVDFGVLSFLGLTSKNVTIRNGDVEKFFSQTLPAVSNRQ